MDRKIIWVGIVVFLALATSFAVYMIFAKPPEFRGTAYVDPYPKAADINLARSTGEPFHLNAEPDRVTLLFFGYTSCPDVCPTTLAELNLTLGQMPRKADRVDVVFVSVDPDRDTPEIVQQYVSRFNPTFIGLSGSIEELQPVWDSYGIFRESVDDGSAAGYIVNHTARTTLIDGDGNLRLSYAFGTSIEDIVHDLNIILE